MTPSAPYEESKFLGSGRSVVARLKREGIDGRALPGVKLAAQVDLTRENSPGQDAARIHIVFSMVVHGRFLLMW